MNKKKVLYSNLFAMILLLLYVYGSQKVAPIFKSMKLSLPMYLVLPQILFLILPTIIYFIITKKSVKKVLRLNKINMKTIFIVIVIALFSMPIALFLSLISQFIFPNRIGQIVSALNSIPFLVKIGIVALTPALCEEITMRGVVLAGYDNIGIKKAAIMTGLLFGILHMDGNQFLYAFALGIIFAYIVRITNSIYSSMIAHFTINGSQLLIAEISTYFFKVSNKNMAKAQKAGLSYLTTHQKISATITYLILATICTFIIISLMKKLIKIHGSKGIEPKVLYHKEEKVINWPIFIIIVLYIYVIGNELISIYK